MISIQLEGWETFFPDCRPLWEAHHAEIGKVEGGLPFDPNVEKGEHLVRNGTALIITARDEDRRMIGYCVFTIGETFECRGVLIGTQGPWFVVPEHRNGSAAFRMFERALKEIEARGVRRAYPHHWLVGDSPKAARIFEHFGAKPEELVYSMPVGSAA